MSGLRAPRPSRGSVISVAIGAAVLLAAVAGGRPGRDGPPLDPHSDGPLGTSALVTLLDELGADVDLAVGLPDDQDDVALLLQDRLDEEQTAELEDWVAGGGTLVVTDPGSPLTPPLAEPELVPGTDPVEPGRCSIDALADIGEVDGGAAVRYDTSEGDATCFDDADRGAYVVAYELGEGDVVAIGGAAFVTNDLLDEADNAVLAATLLVPEGSGHVRFVEPPVPAGGGEKTLTDLVPPGVKRALAQLGVAFVLFALWRAIRLGQPVPEGQPVEVAGSELVSAIGRLLSRSRGAGEAAETVRSALRRRLRARLGAPVELPADALAELAAARTGVDLATARAALGEGPVRTDDELVAVARAVARINQEVPRD